MADEIPPPTGDDDLNKRFDELEDAEQQQLTGFDENAPNLVAFFNASEPGKALLKRIAEQVIQDQKDAWEASEEWREMVAENNRIITGFLQKKPEGMANAHMPVALERLLRLTSNVFVEIFMERDTIFGVQPTGPDDYEVAEILTQHGNWQLRVEQTDFIRQQHRGVWDFFTAGSVFAMSSRDEVKRRNRHDILQSNEIWLPYVWTSYEPDMSDVPYKGRTIKRYRRELEALRDEGKWESVDEVLSKPPPEWDHTSLESKAHEQEQQRTGIRPPERKKNAPYVFFEYHGETQMPGSTNLRPICATVDVTTKSVVKLYIREEEDWRDRARFDAQQAEMETYQQDQQAFEQTQAMQGQLTEALQNPEIAPEDALVMQEAMASEQLEPPVPPAWFEKKMQLPPEQQGPDQVRKVPLEMFSHGVCVENPFGILGLSFGNIECSLNVLVDEALCRYYDQASFSNVSAFMVPESLDFGSTTLGIAPGKVFRVRGVSGEQLKSQVVELKPGPANAQLLDVIRMGMEAADSSVAAPSVLSGEPGKSGETFRGLATRVEKATRQLSAAGMKYLDFLSNILRNNARLNYMFLPEEEMVMVLDHLDVPEMITQGAPRPATREMRNLTIGRDMYRRNYSVTFTADVRFASAQQRITEADELVGMSQHPALAGNLAFQYHALAKALRARGQHDMIPTLGPPPPMPEFPLGMPPPPPPGMGPPGMGPPGGGGEPLPGGEQGEPPPEVAQEMVPPEAQGPVQGPQA